MHKCKCNSPWLYLKESKVKIISKVGINIGSTQSVVLSITPTEFANQQLSLGRAQKSWNKAFLPSSLSVGCRFDFQTRCTKYSHSYLQHSATTSYGLTGQTTWLWVDYCFKYIKFWPSTWPDTGQTWTCVPRDTDDAGCQCYHCATASPG